MNKNNLVEDLMMLDKANILTAFGIGKIESLDIGSILNNRLFSWWNIGDIISQLDNVIDIVNEHVTSELSVNYNFNVMQLIIAQIRQSFTAYWILEGIKNKPKEKPSIDHRIKSLTNLIVNKNNTIKGLYNETRLLHKLRAKADEQSISYLETATKAIEQTNKMQAELERLTSDIDISTLNEEE